MRGWTLGTEARGREVNEDATKKNSEMTPGPELLRRGES